MNTFERLLDTVLPPRCPFTGEIVDRNGMVSAEAWAKLSFIAEPVCAACGFPFEFALPAFSGEALCGPCLMQRPVFNAARSALVYDDASRDLILSFKHGDRLESVTVMIPWLIQAGAKMIAEADLIVPVPLHRWRLLARRYNQAALIGAALGKKTNLQFSADALLRIRATPTQGHLNADERRKNVRHAFAVSEKRKGLVEDKSILLIDDVYTTGSTVEECAKALQAAGAKKVDVLTVARVVRTTRVS